MLQRTLRTSLLACAATLLVACTLPESRQGSVAASAPDYDKLAAQMMQHELTPEESAIAREVAKELSATELRAWFDELGALSVPEAVEKVRKLISGFGKTGGAS